MKNIFKSEITEEVINRINQLNPSSKNLWGKMNVGQMLAHCNVTYEMVYTDKYPKPNAFKKFMLKLFVKKIVVGEKQNICSHYVNLALEIFCKQKIVYRIILICILNK